MICNLTNRGEYFFNTLRLSINKVRFILSVTNTLLWSMLFKNYKNFNSFVATGNKARLRINKKLKSNKTTKRRRCSKLKVFLSLNNTKSISLKNTYSGGLVNNFRKITYYWCNNEEGYDTYLMNWYSNSTFKTESSLYKKSLKRFLKELKVSKKDITKPVFTINSLDSVDPLRLKSVLSAKFFKKYYRTRKWLSNSNIGLGNDTVSDLKNKSKKLNFSESLFSYERKKRRLRNTKRAFIRRKFFRVIKKSRGLFRHLSGINLKGKNRLVKKIKSLNHKSFISKLLSFETSLLSILIKTPFANSLNDSTFLIKNNVVYINGNPSSNLDLSTEIGDKVQLVISRSSYLWLRSKKLMLNKGFKKNLRLFYRKKFKSKGRFKKRSYNYPKWLMKYSIISSKSPTLVEFDLMTLTSILLYKPTHINELNSLLWRWINLNAHSLYLWKVIN